METDNNTENLIDRFNSFFEGVANLKINNGRIEITINGATLRISLPEILGGQSD